MARFAEAPDNDMGPFRGKPPQRRAVQIVMTVVAGWQRAG